MSLATTVNRVRYEGDGVNDTFAYPFKIQANTHLVVVHTDADDVDTTKVLTTDYTVTGVGEASGGNVVMEAGDIPAADEYLTIYRATPKTQATEFDSHGDFSGGDIEEALDKLTMIGQDLQEQVDRSAIVGVSSTTTPATILAAIEAAKVSAEASAVEAASEASDADTARIAAEDAQGFAEDAQGLAEDAQGLAEDAQGLAEDAQGLAEDAQGLAEGYRDDAENAKNAALSHQSDASDAEDAAVAAKDAAEAAQALFPAIQAGDAGRVVRVNSTEDAYEIVVGQGEAGVERNAMNIMINALRLGIAESAAYYNMVDGVIDVFADESGIGSGGTDHNGWWTSVGVNEYYRWDFRTDKGTEFYAYADHDLGVDLGDFADNSTGGASVTPGTAFGGNDCAYFVTDGAGGDAILTDAPIPAGLASAAEIVFVFEVDFEDLNVANGGANDGYFEVKFAITGFTLSVRFWSDACYVYDGAAWNSTGFNPSVVGTHRLCIHAVKATGLVDIYQDQVLVVDGADCSDTSGGAATTLSLVDDGTVRDVYLNFLECSESFDCDPAESGIYVESIAFTALSAPTMARILLLVAKDPERGGNMAACTPNTNFNAYITSDQSAPTWDKVALTLEGDYSSTIDIYSGEVELTDTDTDIAWKVIGADSHCSAYLHGVGLFWNDG